MQSDWNQTTTTADDYIENKPTIPTVPARAGAFTQADETKLPTKCTRMRRAVGRAS